MDIKRADDKPMVIHTKEKTKLHVHTAKSARIKGHNVYSASRTPKIKGSTVNQEGSKDYAKTAYRKGTVHQNKRKSKRADLAEGYRNKRKESGSGIKNVGRAGAGMAADQLEGGNDCRYYGSSGNRYGIWGSFFIS